MTDVTVDLLIHAEDRELALDGDAAQDLFEPPDPARLAAELQDMADKRSQVAAEAAALRLG
ncbi:hypothetical protein [Tessaracoccus defluvii]|uniref:Uncharacterized protein n=1 Tax=Tessaracoccus defluvii TaxID=1285901 RepID=A0A7H0H5R0_9ACTN|nr:hypothetical protein [Tessaracoccus defluvii]QNP55876.1 hypothetical protein H9L22_17510 [Tessaracoccus defluvii]